jgi:alpha-ribazole phosphatase
MIRLLLVRHGQTIWTAVGRYQGHTDVPLDDLGRRQAAGLGHRFAGQPVHAIYSSDLQRARCTAEAIGQTTGVAVTVEPRLREASFGVWEGLTLAQMCEGWPQEFAAWQADPLTRVPPGGETLAQLTARVSAFLDDVKARHQNQTVLLVAHGGTLRAVLCHALNLPTHVFWRIEMNSASVSELRLYEDSRVSLHLLNDCHHLNGL